MSGSTDEMTFATVTQGNFGLPTYYSFDGIRGFSLPFPFYPVHYSGVAAPATPYSVIYSFGDSLSDAGDAYLLTSSSAGAAFGLQPEPVSPPYYAETYAAPGGGTVTADVFSNGPVWVLDLAASLGLLTPGPGQVGYNSVFHPGYTSIAAGAANGTDFAIGGSVTGPTGFNTDPRIALTDLSAQIANFTNEVPQPAATALYTVWSGSNDLLNLLQSPDFATLSASGMAAFYVGQSVYTELGAIRALVQNGAQTVLVLNLPDLGLVPGVTAAGTAVAAAASTLAQQFNRQLATAVATDGFGTSTVKLVDVYGLIDDAVANPTDYGLSNVTGSVYTGGFTSDSPLPTVTGAAQDQYLFFDQFHPTEAGQTAVANLALAALGLACFVRGTRLAVPGGESPVEDLTDGDLVVTTSGAIRPVRWVGHRSYAGRFLAANPSVQPIRLRAGSLGGGLPRRDLLVSPEHAMGLDGMLVPARHLVNGTTVVREPRCGSVDYFHVELDSHDVLLAEGAPSESYVADDNRSMFGNAADWHALHPEHREAPAAYCAPRLESGHALETIRARLAEEAAVLAA